MARRRVRDTTLDPEVSLEIRAECRAAQIPLRKYWELTELARSVSITNFYLAVEGSDLDLRSISAVEHSIHVWRDIQAKRGAGYVDKSVTAAVVQINEIQRALSRLQSELAAVVRHLIKQDGGKNGE